MQMNSVLFLWNKH